MIRRFSLAMLVGACGLTAIAGCSIISPQASQTAPTAEATSVSPATVPPADQPAEATPAPADPDQPDYFREAINRASSAVTLGQSAQSLDDWQLVSSRWQQAISLLQRVPADAPNYTTAQEKAKEYQNHLALAQQRAKGNVNPSPRQPEAAADGRVASIPIVDRWGGTPLVKVTMTSQSNTQTVKMLFDTGATGTLITPQMAQDLGVIVVDQTTVIIADGSRVTLPVGYLDAIEVGGLKKESMLVAIGGDVGLLGQDFYGKYGISLGGNQINLYQ